MEINKEMFRLGHDELVKIASGRGKRADAARAEIRRRRDKREAKRLARNA